MEESVITSSLSINIENEKYAKLYLKYAFALQKNDVLKKFNLFGEVVNWEEK
jgi:hypothetical protein